jgi:phenylacetic acid degradation operon negative regulatory protein
MKRMSDPQESDTGREPEVARARGPRWLVFGLLALFTELRPDAAVSTGTFIEVLSRVGISSHAARSTLSRMTESGAIVRQRNGRETYYSLSPRSRDRLDEGNASAWRRSEPEWNGSWTILGYSISESRRAVRLRLRSRLIWGGFGMLRSGMWLAPGTVDIKSLIGDLGVLGDVQVFHGTPTQTTSTTDLIRQAYDLDAIADRYVQFFNRWTTDRTGGLPDELCSYLALRSEWQQLVQADPWLPSEHLPSGWPAAAAEELFRALGHQLEGRAWHLAELASSTLSPEPG